MSNIFDKNNRNKQTGKSQRAINMNFLNIPKGFSAKKHEIKTCHSKSCLRWTRKHFNVYEIVCENYNIVIDISQSRIHNKYFISMCIGTIIRSHSNCWKVEDKKNSLIILCILVQKEAHICLKYNFKFTAIS